MAGYFSNHSQSRFLANSNSTSSATQTTVAPTPSPAPRPRVPSSKHFSTSLSTSSADEKSPNKDKPSASASRNASPVVHPLRHTWVFWFRQQRGPGTKITNYEEGIKKVSAFSSVESFWSLWTHLHSPSALLPTTDYLLFHSGVRRPVWEDPLNLPGGKWIIRLRKGIADRLWEDLVLAVVGDQFAEWPEICGCTISVRQNEDIISVWNRHDSDAQVKEKVKETIWRVLNLPPTTVMEYKSNNDSMQDKSSFRVPASVSVDRTPQS
ncbi:eukaryotic translation initiation factor 4E class II [Postia placenta Mad-698-R]|nr:eukaryotic translation initiation factor 4E class II [Postia placenta Mad-698-R]